MRTWTAVSVTARASVAEPIESFLIDHGAPGLETEAVEGDRVRITAHFAGPAPLAALDAYLGALAEVAPEAGAAQVAVAAVADTDWADNWKAHFPPLPIGERLFVHPPWVRERPSGRVAIVLDPGMAFGTGHHASTRGCLVLLERALQECPGGRVLDVGTGSGILAIAAAKLGAATIHALDTDAEACAVARENAATNGVADAIAIGGDLAEACGPFDIILANLLAPTLIALAPAFAARLASGGLLIGAGVQRGEVEAVRAAWRTTGLADAGELAEEDWVALAARRRA
jgi:ribosomal protein L11 methyltransferase